MARYRYGPLKNYLKFIFRWQIMLDNGENLNFVCRIDFHNRIINYRVWNTLYINIIYVRRFHLPLTYYLSPGKKFANISFGIVKSIFSNLYNCCFWKYMPNKNIPKRNLVQIHSSIFIVVIKTLNAINYIFIIILNYIILIYFNPPFMDDIKQLFNKMKVNSNDIQPYTSSLCSNAVLTISRPD